MPFRSADFVFFTYSLEATYLKTSNKMEIFDFKHLFIIQFYLDSQIDQKEINENNKKTETILQTKTLSYEYHKSI